MLTKTRLENVNSEFREGLKRKVSSTCYTCECNRLHWWVLQVLCLLEAAEMLWTEWYWTAHRAMDDPALENLFQWGGRPLCDAHWARFYKDHLYDAYIGNVDMGEPTSQQFQALVAAVDGLQEQNICMRCCNTGQCQFMCSCNTGQYKCIVSLPRLQLAVMCSLA